MREISYMLVPRKLTAVLSLDESNALLRRPKYRTALYLTYGAGEQSGGAKGYRYRQRTYALANRASEGQKNLMAMLSLMLLGHFRDWRHFAHAQHLMLNVGWLFPGQQAIEPLSTRQFYR